MFHTLLIANRGEIACRVATTARRLGITTVAVYSDADAGSAHVAACDRAVRIGPPAARDSYLNIDAVLAAAQRSGADAVHPGYGFLSENPAFAEACVAAGLVFVGPPAAAMRAMGDKSAAKARMAAAGVPLVPGYHGDNQDAAHLQIQADTVGYPVILKPSAGGGGKGMRIVNQTADFALQLDGCQREARASFGDDRVLIERYIQQPRHIEIQVFADSHGQCVHLFERDCSIQRRHQKVIEEAPAPGLSPAQRDAMGAAAIAAAQAVVYVGAGTVEFIVDTQGAFYFMEMNTRLQVEHPVTEMITGTDLVAWQLQIAAGAPLPLTQAQLQCRGHAIEARIYAESPETGFLPSIGTLHHLAWPPHVRFTVAEAAMTSTALLPAAVRLDSGIRPGDTLTADYDPMIAKLIVWGESRAQALSRMRQALAQTQIAGVLNNVAFLGRLFADPALIAAELDTGFIERHQTRLMDSARSAVPLDWVAAAACVDYLARLQPAANDQDPWSVPDHWRVAGAYTRRLPLQIAGASDVTTLTIALQGEACLLSLQDAAPQPLYWQRLAATLDSPLGSPLGSPGLGAAHYQVTWNGQCHTLTIVAQAARRWLFMDGKTVLYDWIDPLQSSDIHTAPGGSLQAPMPGKVIAVAVAAGDVVIAGQALVVIEAMKMEHTLTAPKAGHVTDVFYQVGDAVQEGATVLAIDSQNAN